MVQVLIRKYGHVSANYVWYFAKKSGMYSKVERTAYEKMNRCFIFKGTQADGGYHSWNCD